jgi:fibronectin type III domain protein
VHVATLPARSNTGNVTFVDTAVTTSHSYQYRVAAVNSGGQSAPVLSNIVATPAVPLAPSGLGGSAVRSGKRANITLNWTDNSNNETGFTIERATNATFTVGLNQSTVAANAVTVTQTGLYRGVTYFYRIRAFNAGGSSGWSNVFSVVTP